jgi:hypothetical protein
MGRLFPFQPGGFFITWALYSPIPDYLRIIHASSLANLPSHPDWLMPPNMVIRSLLLILQFTSESLLSALGG